jgi:hypothetical protein
MPLLSQGYKADIDKEAQRSVLERGFSLLDRPSRESYGRGVFSLYVTRM